MSTDDDWRRDRVGSALRGSNPTVLARLASGFAVIGDTQFLPGYTLLLSATPGADRITDLPREQRLEFLADVDVLAAAVHRACEALDPDFRRVNIEILGNTDAYLHAHIWPRYEWEPSEYIGNPVWLYPAQRWTDSEFVLGPQHDELRATIIAALALAD
jgi:diadenosine tetraphosphate (Ap4A) HIT family hydrolase